MSNWALALALVGQFIAFGALVLGAFRAINSHIDTRVREMEQRRAEGSRHWQQRLEDRDLIISAQNGRMDAAIKEHEEMWEAIRDGVREGDALRDSLARDYVSREIWLEHVGSMNIKLDRLGERFPRTETPGD